MEMYRDDFVHLERREHESFVRLVRTSRALRSLDELRASTAGVQLALPIRLRAGLRLLSDMRLAPLATDPALERAMGPLLQELFRGFDRRAIVLATAVGKLQAARTAPSSTPTNSESRLFTDEESAVAWLNERSTR